MNNNHNNQAPGVQITPAMQKAIQDAPFIKCVVCDGSEFIQVFQFKPINKLLLAMPTDGEGIFACYQCKHCGHVRGVPAPAKQ